VNKSGWVIGFSSRSWAECTITPLFHRALSKSQ
jgi:hypothetical protein